MRKAAAYLATTLALIPFAARAQIVPPRDGARLPDSYIERMANDPKAYRFDKAWIAKTQRAKEARARLRSRVGGRGLGLSSMPMEARQQVMVAGTVEVPVIMVQYTNSPAGLYPTSDLQAKLFDGPNPNGTVTDLYREMSYGNLTMTGTVYPVAPADRVQLAQPDYYYEGVEWGTNPCTDKTGELILEALVAMDGTTDFGRYDSDGPDGVPNSGDDDGFVDVLAIAHPELGRECPAGRGIWAHRWIVGAWKAFGAQYNATCTARTAIGTAWDTNDARTGGGQIQIWDYVLVPAVGAGGSGCDNGVVEIGVYAHEFGHAFGLPDLYDTNGGGEGIGHHGLMGSGNWNRPTNPPHFTAWSKMELGWVMPIEVAEDEQSYTIANVEQNATVYQLNVAEEKFRRQDFQPIHSQWSLRCGLDDAQADNRNWPGGAGYGNGWNETVERDFVFDGRTPVTLQYDVHYDMELNYDFARIKIGVDGTVSEVKSYTGTGRHVAETIDLTSYLSGSTAVSYTIIVAFESDDNWSDEDNLYNSGADGPFKIDNVSMTGGGENYFTDFETDNGGWLYTTPPKEFFLVENRGKAGTFDQHLYSEGLYIWHIEQNVARSSLGNTGGTREITSLRPGGVRLMEADGNWNLLRGQNRGDPGDCFPGSSGNRTFNNTTSPDSRSHNLAATNVVVRSISSAGATMTAIMSGGGSNTQPPPSHNLSLAQNEPNPFVPRNNSPDTAIRFSLSNAGQVSLNVFDVKGRLVATLLDASRPEGPHQVRWDGTNARGDRVASGVYFYQLRAAGQVANKKMVLLR